MILGDKPLISELVLSQNLINMTRMVLTLVHVCLTYASYGQSPYVPTFHETSSVLSRATTPEKKGS
jgi:hypothetical protein